MVPESSDQKNGKPWKFINFTKDHPLIVLLSGAFTIIGGTWLLCMALYVGPRDFFIKQLETKIVHITEEVGLCERFEKSGVLDSDFKITRVLYKTPAGDTPIVISQNQRVESGGQILLEIKLPEPGGYLLAYLVDRTGKKFNLFPGTWQAITNGYYRVPYHLAYPYTKVEERAAKNTIAFGLPSNNIMIGPYIFDETRGTETFFFFYMDRRNEMLEETLKDAEEIDGEVMQMRGVLKKMGGFDSETIDKKLKKFSFYPNALQLRLRHE